MMITNSEVIESEYEEIIRAGVDDYFLKPFSPRKILLHLKKGLRQRLVLLQKKRLEQELNHMKRKRHPGAIEIDQGNRSMNE